MPNTFTQIHIHVVFTVQNRYSLILNTWKDKLYAYIIAIIQNNGHKVLAIGGMPDHVHILIGFRPTQSLSDLMKHLKGDSAKWINENHLILGHFSWQEGYGAFSYSKSQIPTIINYITKQEEHHKKQTFIEEYKDFLKMFEINFDEKYIFKAIE